MKKTAVLFICALLVVFSCARGRVKDLTGEKTRRIEKNGRVLEINGKNEVIIYEGDRIIWEYRPQKGEQITGVYDEMLSTNAKYACFMCVKYKGQVSMQDAVFVDIDRKKIRTYKPSVQRESHDKWETYEISSTGRAQVFLVHEKDGKITRKKMYYYKFGTQ